MTTICQVAREQADGSCARVEFDVTGLGGDLTVARDVGQPHAEILQAGGQNSGRELPRSQSDFSGADSLVVTGRFDGANAHADAKTLIDDIVKPFIPATDDQGTDLARATPFEIGIDFDGGLLFGAEVGATREDAVALQYPSGTKDYVVVRLAVDIVTCLSLGGGGVSWNFRKVVRDTDTSDLSVSAGEALAVENNTGSVLTVNLPSGPSDNDTAFVINSVISGDQIDVSAPSPDEVQGFDFDPSQAIGAGRRFWYDADNSTWWHE